LRETLDDVTRALVLELFSCVETGVDPPEGAPYTVVGLGPDNLVFQGRALELLTDIRDRLARPALGEGGMHPQAVEAAIVDACRMSREEDASLAVNWLASEIALPNRSWLAAVPIRCHFRGRVLTVGKCRVEQQIPSQASGFAIAEDRDKLIERPWLVTDVLARDRSSAMIVAADHFDEARALLRMLSDDIRRPIHTDIVTISEEEQLSWARSLGDLYIVRRADAAGTLWPSMRELSEAMTRKDGDRTDWERRTVAACRWYHRAASAGWPSASLAGCFTALECLFVEGRNERDKGERVATRVALQRPRMRGMGSDEVADWLRDLYRRRNDTVHEGMTHADELEVAQLEEFTQAAVFWASDHLEPDHRTTGPCTAFEDVHEGEHIG